MKKKLLLLLSLLLLIAFGIFILKSLFINNSELLNIPENGLSFELPERTFKMIESDAEPIRISLGQVGRKQAIVDILLGENNLKKEEMRIGQEVQFAFESVIYTLKLEDIKAKIIGEEVAYFTLNKKGKIGNVKIEKSVAEFLSVIEKEDFEVFKRDRSFDRERFLKKLKHKGRKEIRVDDLIEFSSKHFSKFSIKSNGKIYPVAVWLSLKK